MRPFKYYISVFLLLVSLNAVIFTVPANAEDSQAALEQQLQDIENQITQLQQQLSSTQSAKQTLSKRIKELQIQQNSLRLQIKATNLQIQQLSDKITSTEATIDMEKVKLARYHGELQTLLLTLDSNERIPLLVAFFSQGGTNAFFEDLKNYTKITASIHDLVILSKETQTRLQKEEEDLASAQDDAQQLLNLHLAQQGTLSDRLTEQNQILKDTKGQEAAYQAELADTKKQADQIRSRLYELFGTNKQINFGDAVKIAQWVSNQTSVRAAFLLAILTQETNLGKNVGTCNRAGDPPEKSWKVIMKPDRDQEPFKTITSELGRDIDNTPVSCPLKDRNGNQYGWGGAMGPAQFIPSTWMGYREKVKTITGSSADPWDIRDAFIAAALKLKADGADGTEDGEWKAAMRYFSGSTNTKYRFYGDNVVQLTKKYLTDIASLN